MREILFKAKRLDNGEWVQGAYVKREKWKWAEGKNVTHFILVQDEYGFTWRKINVETLCQFTGLIDKNGKQIWENDIVEIPREDGYFVIDWNDTEAKWQMKFVDGFCYDFDNYWSFEIEVVGNKFDNSELLEEKR